MMTESELQVLAPTPMIKSVTKETVDMTTSTTRMTDLRVYPGSAYPLGATWDGMGVNFAIFSESAEAIELCLEVHGESPQDLEFIGVQRVTVAA